MSEAFRDKLNSILNSMPYHDGMKYVFMDAFFASILSDKNAPKNNYLHTRILGKLLINSVKDLNAMFYPSVSLESAINVAIKTEALSSALKLASNCVIKINKRYDYGIFDISIVKNSKGQDPDGTIVWG